eukprot:6244515-Pyramimonas_sp.AAC.1
MTGVSHPSCDLATTHGGMLSRTGAMRRPWDTSASAWSRRGRDGVPVSRDSRVTAASSQIPTTRP